MDNRKLIFENGREFAGRSFGAPCEAVCEVVFNTSMVGYQEILSDPSYCAQMVNMTYPLIGNYGLTDEDYETRVPKIGGFIVREYNDKPSNYRYTRTLADVMRENNIPGIEGVDTRAITRMLRDEGSMRAILTERPREEALETLRATAVPPVIELVRRLCGQLPIFGICLGHQMIALAFGAKTYKMKFGHRGGNHPVKELATGKVEITSQNHSFAVDPASLAGTGLHATHINLLDQTVEGLACPEKRVFSVQYHPESAPGPQDSDYLFDRFIATMEEGRRHA